MSDVLDPARNELQTLGNWMTKLVKPVAEKQHAVEWKRWQSELASIHECIERPQAVRIALVGTTGAGKSTLLNALLGQQLLQVGVSTSITSFVTLVRYQAGPEYEVEIEYETLEEWARGIERFLQATEPGDDDSEGAAKASSTICASASKPCMGCSLMILIAIRRSRICRSRPT